MVHSAQSRFIVPYMCKGSVTLMLYIPGSSSQLSRWHGLISSTRTNTGTRARSVATREISDPSHYGEPRSGEEEEEEEEEAGGAMEIIEGVMILGRPEVRQLFVERDHHLHVPCTLLDLPLA